MTSRRPRVSPQEGLERPEWLHQKIKANANNISSHANWVLTEQEELEFKQYRTALVDSFTRILTDMPKSLFLILRYFGLVLPNDKYLEISSTLA